MAETATATETETPKREVEVTVVQMGARLKLSRGTTVKEAIIAAKMDPEKFKVTLNNEDAGLDETLRENDIIILVPQMRGGAVLPR